MFENNWSSMWWYLDRNPTYLEAKNNPSLKYNGMRPQKNISSEQLVRGMSLYNKISQDYDKRIVQDDSQELLERLQTAARHGSFAALQSLSKIVINKLSSNHSIDPNIFRPLLLEATKWHGTPVYLLLTDTYIAYAEYYKNKGKTTESKIEAHRALEYLYAAKYSRAQCEDEIHNAYHGKGHEDLQVLENNIISNYNIKKPIADQADAAGQALVRLDKHDRPSNTLVFH